MQKQFTASNRMYNHTMLLVYNEFTDFKTLFRVDIAFRVASSL